MEMHFKYVFNMARGYKMVRSVQKYETGRLILKLSVLTKIMLYQVDAKVQAICVFTFSTSNILKILVVLYKGLKNILFSTNEQTQVQHC